MGCALESKLNMYIKVYVERIRILAYFCCIFPSWNQAASNYQMQKKHSSDYNTFHQHNCTISPGMRNQSSRKGKNALHFHPAHFIKQIVSYTKGTQSKSKLSFFCGRDHLETEWLRHLYGQVSLTRQFKVGFRSCGGLSRKRVFNRVTSSKLENTWRH